MLLAQAGMRSNEAMIRYLFARLAMPFVFGALVIANSYTLHMLELPVPDKLRTLAALGAAVLGFFAPDVYIKNLVKKRAHQMELGLPDALDLLVICAEAGLSLDASLQRVSRELELTWPELSEEFGITAGELTYLPDRKQAFENLNARTNMASDPRRREHAAADRQIRHAAGPVACASWRPNSATRASSAPRKRRRGCRRC